MSDMVKIGGLWNGKTKDGKDMLSGSLGFGKLMIFPNGFKKKDTDPDWNVFIGPGKSEQKREAVYPANNNDKPFSATRHAMPPAPMDDDLPF